MLKKKKLNLSSYIIDTGVWVAKKMSSPRLSKKVAENLASVSLLRGVATKTVAFTLFTEICFNKALFSQTHN